MTLFYQISVDLQQLKIFLCQIISNLKNLFYQYLLLNLLINRLPHYNPLSEITTLKNRKINYMHKYLYLLTATYFLTLNSSLSQNLTSIAPNTINSAYCPNTNISFTVTIANTGSSGKYYSSPQAISYPIPTVTGCIGAVITSSATMTSDGTNTYIKFTGHFTDANQPQGIEVSYYDNNNMFWKSDYHYDEIQSFAIPDVSKSEPKPSPSSIKATRCQSQTFNVSFLNVRTPDDFPTPKLVYGTVTSYQYLLPSGWKLNGGAPSDGTTWLSATTM